MLTTLGNIMLTTLGDSITTCNSSLRGTTHGAIGVCTKLGLKYYITVREKLRYQIPAIAIAYAYNRLPWQ